jgi:hypothetical protein
MTDVESAKMDGDLAKLCEQWRDSGIEPVSIIAFLLQSSMNVAEHAGVKHEIAQAVLDRAYGRNNFIRPTVKA